MGHPSASGSNSITVLNASNPAVFPASSSTLSHEEAGSGHVGDHENPHLVTQTTDYEEDKFMFRNVGHRFKDHLKQFGEGFRFQRLFSPKSPTLSDTRRLSDSENIAPDDFEDITRLIWSAFRVPFNALSESSGKFHAIPVILSLIKVVSLLCFPIIN
jgi:hypothetical protein